MLGKLIKYDLKYGAKMFTVLHAVLLIACAIGRFFILHKINLGEDTNILSMIDFLFFSMIVLLFTSVSLGMSLLLAVRFYKSLFTDEAYLTWTLPATPSQHLWSKILSGAIWYTAHLVLNSLAFTILIAGTDISSIWRTLTTPEAEKAAGMPLDIALLYLLLYLLTSTLCGIVIIYACISIGQLFSGHRVLCSIAIYFIISFIFQLLILVVMWLTGLLSGQPVKNATEIDNLAYIFKTSFTVFTLFSLTIAALLYIVSLYILKKKVNLL